MKQLTSNEKVPPNILLYGPAGTGKSYSVTTYSGPVLLLQTEPGLVSALANESFRQRVESGQSHVFQIESWGDIDPMRTSLTDWLKAAGLGNWMPELVVLDSVTWAAELAKEEILRRMPSKSGVPELHHWMLITEWVRQLVRGVVRCKAASLIIAQADIRDIEEPGSSQQAWLPGMPGRYATKITHDVDFVVFARRDTSGKFVVDTQASASKLGKTRALELPRTMELNLDELVKALSRG